MSSLKINLETGKIEYIQVDYDAEMQSTIENVKNILNSTIVRELTRTDYTQANDAVEHMTQEQIDAYKIYRSTLRSAINAPTLLEAIQLLPDVDPKGNSVFQEFKEQLNT
jgi:predicted transcriptional regulator